MADRFARRRDRLAASTVIIAVSFRLVIKALAALADATVRRRGATCTG
jgi:hypothetical protein